MTRQFGHDPMNLRLMSPILRALVIANVVVFILSILVGGEFVRLFGLVPYQVVYARWVWQPFTYLFLHGGPFHLLINLLVLWMFGMAIESQWGSREFLKYYLICGVGAGLCNVALTPHSLAPVVGASGAIYGLIVAFALLYPDAVVYLYFLFPVKAKHMAIGVGVLEFLSAATEGGGGAMSSVAHLGGMVVGYAYLRWWWLLKIRCKALLSRRGSPAAGSARRRASAPEAPEGGRPSAPPTETRPVTAGDDMAEVDRILDKILAQGEASLTQRERDFLRRHAKPKPEGHA